MENIKLISTKEEQEQFVNICRYCFKDPLDWQSHIFPLKGEDQAWGVFREGELSSGVILSRYEVNLWNSRQKLSGIGGVASLPEGRNRGHIRILTEKLLLQEYKEGAVVSALYPFLFNFYEKFGYGNVGGPVFCRFTPEDLAGGFKPAGEFVRFNETEQELHEVYSLFDRWIKNFTFCIDIPSFSLEKFMNDSRWPGCHYYVYKVAGRVKGFCQFRILPGKLHKAKMEVWRIAWDDVDALRAIFHLLKIHRNQCSEIEAAFPAALPVELFMKEPRVFREKWGAWMARPLDIMKLLLLKAKQNPAPGEILFSVKDDIIKENSGTYTIYKHEVRKEAFSDVYTLKLPVFASLLFGAYSADEMFLSGALTQAPSGAFSAFFRKDGNIHFNENF